VPKFVSMSKVLAKLLQKQNGAIFMRGGDSVVCEVHACDHSFIYTIWIAV